MGKAKKDEFRFKVLTDPVHGDIGLSELEVELVDTQSFQRLGHLKQLGLAKLVYPSAGHSRFSHSIGVFHIMGRAIDLLHRRGKFDDAERRKLRVAALLHDIGHYPYSHLMEYIDNDPLRSSLLSGSTKQKAGAPYPSHEKLGELIITKRRDIARTLKSAGMDPVEIAKIIRGSHVTRKYNQLIHSTLDLDRMDYLVRDAIFTGVPFGKIDLNYLISNLDIDSQGNLVLRKKAATAIEHFIAARYFMSKAVYLHKTVFGFEALLRQALYLLRKAGLIWRDGKEIERVVQHPQEFLSFHDGHIDRLIEEQSQSQPPQSPVGRLCRAIRDRRPPKLIAEVLSLSPKGGSTEEMSRFLARRKDRLDEAVRKSGIPRECWLSEDPKPISFEKLGPLVALTQAADAAPDDIDELVCLMDESGKTMRLVEDKSSIIHHLSNLSFHMARLYVVESDRSKLDKARKLVKDWLKP